MYVFGEFHSKEIDCSNVLGGAMEQEVHIEEILFTLLQKTYTFLDIFIE